MYRRGGTYQIFPPGRSYRLHEKDFEKASLQRRTAEFQLGPYFYLTVLNSYEAGVFRKKDGIFTRLQAGSTYQLNEEDFQKPTQTKRDSHVTRVGPLTLLTVEEGTLNGATRAVDGQFEEFTDASKTYELHEKKYHHVTKVLRNKNIKQDFGPFKVITIRQGDVGQFEVEGKIKIMDPGFYKVDSATEIRESIPMQVFQELLDQQDFRTKDGVSMSVKMTVTWQVNDPIQVATFNGTFQDLKKRVRTAASDSLIRLCKQYNRGDLLPTAQDVALFKKQDMTTAEASKMADESYHALLTKITAACVADLTEIASSSKLGIIMNRIQVERFNLQNEDILRELERITMSEMQTKAVEADNKKQQAVQQADMDMREKRADADASVNMKVVKSAALAKDVEVQADNAARIKQAEADNQIQLERNKTEVDIQANRIIMESESKAKAILAITDAEYERKVKEAEAASHMPPQEFELKKLQLQVDMLKEIGHAAWKYPDVYTGFLEQFGDKLRLGPMSVSETLARMGPEGAGAAGQMDK